MDTAARRVGRIREAEHGFTLIELLVVIIIIGILAAIAIPQFLTQKTKGYDAAATSDLRNLASFEEDYLQDFGVYGDMNSVITKEPRTSLSHTVHISVLLYDASNGYCLSAKSDNSPHTFYYDSTAGGIQPSTATGCVMTTGVPGGTYP